MKNHNLIKPAAAFLLAVSLLQAQKAPTPKGPKEVEALQALFAAQDPDARIKAGDNVLTNFANTEFKSIVLYMMAESYGRKGDQPKLIVYGERSLEADPKNYQAMLLLAQGIANKVGENDLDKDERLSTAEKYANSALENIKTAPKMNAQMTDEQWAEAQKDFTADAHQALGIAASQRKKYDVAITEFKMATDTAAHPDAATMVRLGQAYNRAKRYDEAVAVLDKVLAQPDVNPQIKQFAQAEKVRATQKK